MVTALSNIHQLIEELRYKRYSLSFMKALILILSSHSSDRNARESWKDTKWNWLGNRFVANGRQFPLQLPFITCKCRFSHLNVIQSQQVNDKRIQWKTEKNSKVNSKRLK